MSTEYLSYALIYVVDLHSLGNGVGYFIAERYLSLCHTNVSKHRKLKLIDPNEGVLI
ncbi:MAG: hypothetical protein IPQ18_10785 [Saprospiraceae bacterium]|nr:hypothetical protein [Saprospiraceae bacterium]